MSSSYRRTGLTCFHTCHPRLTDKGAIGMRLAEQRKKRSPGETLFLGRQQQMYAGMTRAYIRLWNKLRKLLIYAYLVKDIGLASILIRPKDNLVAESFKMTSSPPGWWTRRPPWGTWGFSCGIPHTCATLHIHSKFECSLVKAVFRHSLSTTTRTRIPKLGSRFRRLKTLYLIQALQLIILRILFAKARRIMLQCFALWQYPEQNMPQHAVQNSNLLAHSHGLVSLAQSSGKEPKRNRIALNRLHPHKWPLDSFYFQYLDPDQEAPSWRHHAHGWSHSYQPHFDSRISFQHHIRWIHQKDPAIGYKKGNWQQDSRAERGQKGKTMEFSMLILKPGLSDIFDLSRINQVARPHTKARAGEDKGFSTLIWLESTCIPSKSLVFSKASPSPNSSTHLQAEENTCHMSKF